MLTFWRIIRVISASILLLGCDNAFEHRGVKHQGLVYCGAIQPKTLNPQRADGELTADVLSNQLFDRLVKLDPNNHRPIPMLATHWSVDPTGTEYRFHLRKNARFHHNLNFNPTRALNADDVVFSFKRLIDPMHPYHAINDGGYPWFDSLNFAELISDIRAVTPHQVHFILSRPDVSFLPALATSYAVIHSQEYADTLMHQGQPERIDHHPIGTGPFQFDELEKNRFIRLIRHWQYWDGAPKLEQIIFDTSHRGTGNLTKLFTRECDVLASPVASQLSVIKEHPQFSLTAETGMNVSFLALNTLHPILSKQEIRQAINLAINRDTIIERVYHGAGKRAQTILPPPSWAHDHQLKHEYDPNLAINLIANAGYRHGFSIDLVVPESAKPYNPSPLKTAEMIQSQLANVGITVNLIIENTVNRQMIRHQQNKRDMVLVGWIADNSDPDAFLRPHLSCKTKNSNWNLSNWCNDEFDATLDEGISTKDIAQRKEIYRNAQSILDDHMPIIPLVYGIQYQANINNLQGLVFSPFGDVSFSNVSRSH